MAAPRVFISSTYMDLADARSVVENHFRELLYETVVFERGGIYFDHRKPLDLSCYDAVKDCDLMILILGGRYGCTSSETYNTTDGHSYNSITKGEYLEALSAGIPVFTFVKQDVLHEYYSYINQPKKQRKNYHLKSVDNVLIFQLISEIFALRTNNLIIEYQTVSEILQYLKKATASLVHDAIKSKRVRHGESEVQINGYKLFYHRRRHGFSHTRLSEATRTRRNLLTSLENVMSPSAVEKHGNIFRSCSINVIDRLERVLKCEGQLAAGQDDDLLSLYIQYYHCNRGKKPIRTKKPGLMPQSPLFPIKCVIFDFDGTLTRQNDRTTWEMIWEELGYTVQDCARLHRDFSNKVIDHKEWCQRTCDAFNANHITDRTLRSVANKIELISGVPELLQILEENAIEMHILSGSIEQIIHLVLGKLANKFTHIQANSFKFSGNVLSYIQGTDFDFEGKARYVSNLLQLKRLSQMDLLFVGNSSNDRWVSRAGITTLCVNPHFTDGNDEKEWLYCIREMHDMREILKYIRLP